MHLRLYCVITLIILINFINLLPVDIDMIIQMKTKAILLFKYVYPENVDMDVLFRLQTHVC